MGDNKQLICDYLCKAIQQTRNNNDLVSITYRDATETCTLQYVGYKVDVNVACDSGCAMIRDIMKHVD